jgi:SIR2-like domain
MAGAAGDAFFQRTETKDAIRGVAVADEVTLVIGAGLSADQGLLTWESLVSALVKDSSRRLHVTDEVREAFVKHLMEAGDLLAAGSLAKAILGDGLVRRVRQHLYYDEERHEERRTTGGLFAASVAEFALTRLAEGSTSRIHIITTNYDSLLEEAFTSPSTSDLANLARGLGITVEPVYGDRSVAQGVLPIYHIHGYVGRDGTASSDVILSERDFGLSVPEDWPTEVVRGLAHTT